jgi:putative FmdB family regulatory protein
VPVYEYRCLECDDVFEQRQTIGEADAARCPEGHDRVKRLLSMFAVGARTGPPAAAGGCCGGACGCG